MAAGATTGRTVPHCLEGGESSSLFSHVPEYIGSLIPPPGASQGGESSVSAQAGTTDDEGIGAAGSGFDAVSGEGGSSHDGFGCDELGCGMDERLAQDLGPGIDGDAAQDLGHGIDGASGIDGAGNGTSSAKQKRFRGRKGSDVRVGPPRDVGAVELAMRNSTTRTTKYILEPVVGTCFDSLAEAYEFYNLYSWEVGFGIRYGHSYTNGEHYKSPQDLICQLEGFDRRDKNDSARCGCKAMIRLHRSDNHGWFVETNRPDHNHPLSDNCGEKMQWNSHKRIDQAMKDTVRYLRENNVSLSKVHCILGSMHRSGDKLPFLKKSLRTICQQIAFSQKDDDIKKTIDLFWSMRSADPDFAFRFDLDPEGRIKNLIWTSGRSRRQYSCFGNVGVFDTTYTTNLYKMPFGLFVGVNNHFQTVIYAGILMSEETNRRIQLGIYRICISYGRQGSLDNVD